VNSRTGRERTFGLGGRRPARRVLVIGGGPAGAAAAIEAARAGDEVTLVERESELGGQLRLAGLAPGHGELWERYRRSTAARLRAAAIAWRAGRPSPARRRTSTSATCTWRGSTSSACRSCTTTS
jgi:2,4-dienoyl-CoA reductase (NADPH2)